MILNGNRKEKNNEHYYAYLSGPGLLLHDCVRKGKK